MGKICFIVGHGKSSTGGYDSGAVSGDYHEFKIAREIAKFAQQYYNENYNESADLMNYEGSVYLTDRIKKVNANDYDFVAEIHLNSASSKTATGTECFYSHGSKTGQKYADKICDYISADLKVKQRVNGTDDGGDKVKTTGTGVDYFAIIRETKCHAVLVETVFISNTTDLAKVKTATGQKKCGIAIAKAVAEVRGVKKKTTKKKTEYFTKYTGKTLSIVDALVSIGVNHTFTYRCKIANANNIKNYKGSAEDNTKMLKLLKTGKLIKP